MHIRKVLPEEFELLWAFYSDVSRIMAGSEFDPGWDMIYYPDEKYLTESISDGQVIAMFDGGKIISSMVINHELEGDFDDRIWNVEAKWDEVLVIHTFGVHPDYHRKGISKEMMNYIISYAEENNYKAIRLDVIPGNTPAERLYKSFGFYYVGTFTETWDDGSTEVFNVYEKEITCR